MKSKSLFVILIFAALILIFGDIFIAKIHKNEITSNTRESISSESIDSLFIHCLNSFLIDSNYINKNRSSRNKNEKIKYLYSLKLPSDLPIPVVLQEIFSVFKEKEVEINSVEKTINYTSTLDILNDGKIILKAEFILDPKLKRQSGTIDLVIQSSEITSDNELKFLLDFPDDITLLISPSVKNKDVINQIKENQKRYLLFLNDAISDLDFRLNKNYSNKRNLISIKQIIGSFGDFKKIFFDTNSELTDPKIYQFIKNNFEKRGYVVFPITSLLTINSNSKEEAVESYKSILRSINTKDTLQILLQPKQLEYLSEIIKTSKKTGLKYSFAE